MPMQHVGYSMPQYMPVHQLAPAPPPPRHIQHAAPPPPASSSVSTLIVGGLSASCSEQELQHFFQTQYHGFERLKFMPFNGSKPGLCFVKFETGEHANATFQAIVEGGDTLASNPGVPLRPEWAKNDLDAPRQGAGGGPQPGAYSPYAAPMPPHARAVPPPPAPQQQWRAAPGPPQIQAWPQAAPPAPAGNDTMFIGGIEKAVPEGELQGVLEGLPGFVRMKMTQGHLPTAFALFDSIPSCSAALRKLHGMALPSAPHQALNCEFAKNSLDKRARY